MSQLKQIKITPKHFLMDLDEEMVSLYERDSSIAIDCEMMGLNPKRDRLCLVQLCDSMNHYSVVQVLPGQKEAKNLKRLFENPKVTKIFHFARMDTLFLKSYLDINVMNVFCTKIASKLARTYTDKHGLKELIREFFDHNLDKRNQSSDWGKKNLSKEQLEYACEDVRFLISLQHILSEILIRENRMPLAEKCFATLPTLVELDILELKEIFEH